MNIKFYIVFLLIAIPFSGIAQLFETTFQNMIDSVYESNRDALGILIHVESPDHNISWTSAVGFSDSARTTKLSANQPVLLASNTKSYVSASILRLVEEGKLTLDEPINGLINPTSRDSLKNDGYDLTKITIRHLLSHTSGIHDYVDDDYFKFLLEQPQYKWSRAEQIQLALKIGEPISKPGETYNYADVNYLLLTEIIEKITEAPFFSAMRQLLKYQEFGLMNTWFEGLEVKPNGMLSFAHQYAKNYQYDSYDLNPSWDLYGGGGIASTVKDAALFFQYLFEGKIIKDKNILKEMYNCVLPPAQSKYCLGLYHFDFGYHLFYHGGWWGTDVNYSPETNTSIAVVTLVKEKRSDINPFLGKKIHELLMLKSE